MANSNYRHTMKLDGIDRKEGHVESLAEATVDGIILCTLLPVESVGFWVDWNFIWLVWGSGGSHWLDNGFELDVLLST